MYTGALQGLHDQMHAGKRCMLWFLCSVALERVRSHKMVDHQDFIYNALEFYQTFVESLVVTRECTLLQTVFEAFPDSRCNQMVANLGFR